MNIHQAHNVEVCDTNYGQMEVANPDILRVADINLVEEVNAAGEKRTA